MLVFGTQMHIVTFLFVSIEIVIFFYLLIYKLARPDDEATVLNIVLIFLLILYNITGGLLPDPQMPGSFFIQECVAYATGFIAPSFFPYYVCKAFQLEKMRFHAFKGVYFFLIAPYILFVITFAITGHLTTAQNILIVPVLYAVWVIITLFKAIKYKYGNQLKARELKEEIAVLFFSLTPWVGLPVIVYFDMSQAIEASITNTGFLLLLALQLSRHIKQLRLEHQRLLHSERRLLNWNTNLQNEVKRRTKELEKLNEQKTYTLVNLAHETKTPLTLINNYLDEYIQKQGSSEELEIIKKGIDKLTLDILNLFDLERIQKGMAIFNHDVISDFSSICEDSIKLFQQYALKNNIAIKPIIAGGVFVKADPVALNRIVNNLVDNAIKFSSPLSTVEIELKKESEIACFNVRDNGSGIPEQHLTKVFEPYYQIGTNKKSIQGMGLGLPIVKKIVDDLQGSISIKSDVGNGTAISICLPLHSLDSAEKAEAYTAHAVYSDYGENGLADTGHDASKPTLLLVEDNKAMLRYLSNKLKPLYNVYTSTNGSQAMKKLKDMPVPPALIVSDVMMDQMDGYQMAKALQSSKQLQHIPLIFVSAKSGRENRLEGLRKGAVDFIQKPFSIEELQQKINSLLSLHGKRRLAILEAVSQTVTPLVSEPLSPAQAFDQNCKNYNLTNRESEIAKRICNGQSYKSVGDELFIAERTVAKHVQNIFEKTGTSNKMELCRKLEISQPSSLYQEK